MPILFHIVFSQYIWAENNKNWTAIEMNSNVHESEVICTILHESQIITAQTSVPFVMNATKMHVMLHAFGGGKIK